VGIEADPVRGTGRFKVALGGGGETRRVSGKIEAVELDNASRVGKMSTAKGEMRKAAERWRLLDIRNEMQQNGDKTIKPHFRVAKWEDPDNSNQIYVNRDYLVERLGAAESGRSHAKHYAYLPKNWLNLVM